MFRAFLLLLIVGVCFRNATHTNIQAEAKTLREQAQSAAEVAAAAQAAAEAEGKSLREELQGLLEAFKASEASRMDAEKLLAETKQV